MSSNTTANKGRTTKRHHENEMVHNAVSSYEEAIYARTDLNDQEKEEAVAKYANSMNAIWESPDRGSKK